MYINFPSIQIQLKYLAEEMQAISKGLEKVVQELAASENDGHISGTFCKVSSLKSPSFSCKSYRDKFRCIFFLSSEITT